MWYHILLLVQPFIFPLFTHGANVCFLDNAKLSFYATSKKLAECKALFNNVLANVFPGFKPKAW